MNLGADMASRIESEAFRQGRSVASVLRRADMSPPTVMLMKSSKLGPTAASVVRLCDALGKDPNWLFGWNNE